jgi:exodeoxyribonuclease VII large subunit
VRIARSRRDLEGRDERLASAVRRHVATARRRFEVLAGKLQALSPLAVLARGYAIARRPQGPVVMRASEVRPEERLEVLLHEGRLGVRVEEVGSVTSQEATEKCRERDGTGC